MPPRTPANDPNCIQLHSGKYYNPCDVFRSSEVLVSDIANSLSKICRFGGHCKEFYSVAQHSVHVAEYVWHRTHDRNTTLCALFHDAAEAYVGDIVNPLKTSAIMASMRDIEQSIMTAINIKLDLKWTRDITALVKEADYAMLSCEALLFMRGAGRDWNWKPERPRYTRTIVPLGWRESLILFDGMHYDIQTGFAE